MEGPSLKLAAGQLQPFIGKGVLAVRGNSTKVEKERCRGQVVKDVFSHGKQLFMQFGHFALRTHFLLFGTYEAEVEGDTDTGDYVRSREPRLALTFSNGELRLFGCSLRYIEGAAVRKTLDFSTDVLAPEWDPKQALAAMAHMGGEEISDVLLDQEVFAGVGNIIKNEVLSPERISPKAKVRDLSVAKRRAIIWRTVQFSGQFLQWRRDFQLRKNLLVHARKTCPHCGGPLLHEITGKRQRRAHYCLRCQRLTWRGGA